MKIGAVYIRVSTEDQARDGYSLDAQLKAIKKYAQSNNIIIESKYIFCDEGISGRKAEKRPAFMEMIKQAKSKPKKFDLILVHKFDRFSRNREDSVVYKALLKKEYNIPVISISEPLDPDDKMSVIMEAFLEAMAEYYSLNLSGEVKKGQLEKHSKGQLQTRPSFGYNVSNNRLIINNSEAKIVKLIFEQYTIEHLSMMQICKNLNNLKIKTKSGNSFENRTIYYILNNPTYIGKLRYTPNKRKGTYSFDDLNTIIVNGDHEPIINIELWNMTQNELAKNNKWKKPKQHIDVDPKTWIKGIVRCKDCGCTMVMNGKNKIRCNGYNKGKCNNNVMINVQDIYKLIIETIRETITHGIINNIIEKKEKCATNQYEILIDKLYQLKEKEKRIKEAYQDGIDTKEEYKENKRMILKEIEKINKEIKNLDNSKQEKERKKEIIENGKKVYEILLNDKISIKEKNDVVHHLINKIEFDKNNNLLELYYN